MEMETGRAHEAHCAGGEPSWPSSSRFISPGNALLSLAGAQGGCGICLDHTALDKLGRGAGAPAGKMGSMSWSSGVTCTLRCVLRPVDSVTPSQTPALRLQMSSIVSQNHFPLLMITSLIP